MLVQGFCNCLRTEAGVKKVLLGVQRKSLSTTLRRPLQVFSHRKLARACTVIALTAGLTACTNNKTPGPDPDPVPECDPSIVAPAEVTVGSSAFPTATLAQDVLRSDISTQGLEDPDQYGLRLAATIDRHRVGEILMQPAHVLREVTQEPSGNYRSQIATLMAGIDAEIASVLAADGSVHIKVHCSTPRWMATHNFPHNVVTGIDKPSGEPTWACSAPTDLAEWGAIMRGVGEHYAANVDRISFSFGSEPENYFAGTRDELFAWYAASVNGLRAAAPFRVGGLTFVGHRHATMLKTAPTLNGSTLEFTEVDYLEPITKTWIEQSATQGLPIDMVTLHQFGGSAVPAIGTRWRRARHDISDWLTQNGYTATDVEVLIEDWPQWAPYMSNDTEYYAAHMASGILSMLELSLNEGAPIRPVQAFLFDFGFRPPGEHPAGFAGRAGLSTELGIIKPVFNLNSLLAEVEGTLTPVESSNPFMHAIAGVGTDHTTVLITNQIPLEYQIDVFYNFWDQRPIMENEFSADDLSAVAYDPLELIDVYFGGVMPGWPELIDAFLAEPSTIDLNALSWPDEIKAQWEEMRRYGRLARKQRSCAATAQLRFDGLADGTYRVEHYVLDIVSANAYRDRDSLGQRMTAALDVSTDAAVQEALAINQEYDMETGKQPDTEVQLTTPRQPVSVLMQPNSVHLIRLTRR